MHLNMITENSFDPDAQPAQSKTPASHEILRCCGCGTTLGMFDPDSFGVGVAWPIDCPDCRRKYPPSLLKAASDYFDYALQLRTGEIIRFSQAAIHGEFVTLELQDNHEQPNALPYPFPRGVDVRISDIVWCADAPEGS